MPALKQLTCTVETGADNIPLTEYKTEYADGFVETYIRVPSNEATFSIHLKSHGYIAPGLAMFVFMDGIPQCNRNRRGLTIPTASSKPFDTEIDFRVRQKEDRVDSRKFIGREWTFAQLNTGTKLFILCGVHLMFVCSGSGQITRHHQGSLEEYWDHRSGRPPLLWR